jgi:cysteinyl-tRNA synthetase
MSPLQLYTTRMCAKQTFVPADPSGQVGLFACGPTVYDLPHLGHAKTYTQFDFLVRLLRARGAGLAGRDVRHLHLTEVASTGRQQTPLL